MAKFLFVNGSLRGELGNTQLLLEQARLRLPEACQAETLTLASYAGSVEALAQRLVDADALLFATGVYWSSWGSPLQRFLEVMTSYELTPCFLGKPAGVLVNLDSVGGMDVAQRLQGALCMLGCVLPPLSGVVLTRTGLALQGQPGAEDVFQLDDLRVALKNLALMAEAPRPRWQTWEIARLSAISGAFPQAGPLDLGLERMRF